MSQSYTTFSYIKGDSLIHKCPAWVKILIIPVINILFFNLPVQFCLCLILFQFVISFLLKFTFHQQIADLKPVLYYGFLLIFTNALIYLFTNGIASLQNDLLSYVNNPLSLLLDLKTNETFLMLVKLFCILQSTSIFFKTSTSLQIRESLETIELCVRKIIHLKKECTISNAVSLFINFIPMVWAVWFELKRAWFARKGKNGIKMYLKLMPVLFSVGMKKAWNTARAVQIRQKLN